MTAPNLEVLSGLIHGFGTVNERYPADITLIRQIHSCLVWDVTELGSEAEGDGLICSSPGQLVGVKTADCVPVLLVDPSSGKVAAVHAGWRGSAENITSAAVRKLVGTGGDAAGVIAAVGPSIGPCCYETGPEVVSRFEPVFHSRRQASGKAHLDLPSVNESQLRAEGVRNIWVARECTFCAPDRFESFRRDGEKSGRMISYIGWKRT